MAIFKCESRLRSWWCLKLIYLTVGLRRTLRCRIEDQHMCIELVSNGGYQDVGCFLGVLTLLLLHHVIRGRRAVERMELVVWLQD